jgi:hypothetical protein
VSLGGVVLRKQFSQHSQLVCRRADLSAKYSVVGILIQLHTEYLLFPTLFLLQVQKSFSSKSRSSINSKSRWAELGTQKKRQYYSTSPHPECLTTPSAKRSSSNVVSTEHKRAVVTTSKARLVDLWIHSQALTTTPLQSLLTYDEQIKEASSTASLPCCLCLSCHSLRTPTNFARQKHERTVLKTNRVARRSKKWKSIQDRTNAHASSERGTRRRSE